MARSNQAFATYERASPTLLAAQPAEARILPFRADPAWGDLYTHLEARLSMLRSWRLSWWEHWALLARYFLPRRYHWLIASNTMTRGFPINQEIVDSTGTLAARVCSSGMMSGLSSPSRPWFKMKAGMGNRMPEIDAAGKEWLEEVEDRMYAVMAESNFYDALAQMFEDLVIFGTATVLIYEDEEDLIRCYNPCAGEFFLASGSSFRVESFYRLLTLTVAQIVEMFGLADCPPDIKSLWETKGAALETERVIAQAIEPNFAIRRRDGSSGRVLPHGGDGGDFTWREAYWVWGQQNERPLSLRGFHEQPFIAPRWATTSNDAYGRCPAMDALPDVMQLQLMTRREAEAIEKQVRPPLLAGAELKNQPSSTLPGQVTYVTSVEPGKGMRPIYEVMPDLSGMEAKIAAVQARINRAFFTDIFLMISQMEGVQPRNELEIYERKGEKIQMLGPVIERFQSEAASPAIARIFGIMSKKGLLPPMPDSLRHLPLQIDYVSEMALAQRAAATGGIERFMATVGNLVAAYPEARDKVDADALVDEYADLLNVTRRILRTPQALAQLRGQRAQQQQQAAMVAATQAAVQGAETLSNVDVGGGQSAMAAMAGGGPSPGGV